MNGKRDPASGRIAHLEESSIQLSAVSWQRTQQLANSCH